MQSHLQETEWFPGWQNLTVTWLNVLTHLQEACVNQKWHCSAIMHKEKRVTKAMITQRRRSLAQQTCSILARPFMLMRVGLVAIIFHIFSSRLVTPSLSGWWTHQFFLVWCHYTLNLSNSLLFLLLRWCFTCVLCSKNATNTSCC